jgi:hypothetical protein
MKIFILYCGVLSSLFVPLEAALPPFYQSTKEITAALNSPEASQFFDSADLIIAIEKKDNGYLITTNRQKIFAEIVPQEAPFPGPIPFTVRYKRL